MTSRLDIECPIGMPVDALQPMALQVDSVWPMRRKADDGEWMPAVAWQPEPYLSGCQGGEL